MPSAAPRAILACVPIALALAFGSAAAIEGFAPTEEGPAYPDSADGRKAAKPTIQAHRLNGDDIRLDGRLDDTAWLAAPAARGFRVAEPDRGAVPAQETVFKVAYDEGNLYFGVACLRTNPSSKISASLTRRDHFSNSDVVAIFIDPYHDHTTGYAFKVNPLGVQLDSYVYNNGDMDDDWDAVWEAETSRDDQGWYAEIRIPFSAIRYRSGADMTWGLNVYQYIQALGQDTAWRTWDRKQAGFVSNFGELTGLSGVRAPRQLELLPYVVQRETDHSMVGTPAAADKLDGFQNLGADLKYGVTSDLTLNATVQPDFGQVEADPAVLNLSPFETSFQEKRPFFVEGSRFFSHRNFDLFYSRRIGTGDENARIRYAAKLTGKTVGNVSVAALAASTDITDEGRAHNIFKNGRQLSRFFVTRLGKEFSQGRHRFNVMQTAVLRTANRDLFGDGASREAYTTGADFLLSSPKRTYTLSGSFVGSIIDPEPLTSAPSLSDAPRYGTGGAFDLGKNGGKSWRWSLGGRWESDKLDINDMGFLSSPDEIGSYAWLQRRFNPEGKSSFYNTANLNLNLNRSWMYAGRTGYDVTTGLPAWHYGPGHPQYAGGNINGWIQFKNYREAWFGTLFNEYGNHRWETRGGPIIGEPLTYGGWLGASTDRRKPLNMELEGNWNRDKAKNISLDLNMDLNWNQSSAVNHSVSLNYHNRFDDTQHLYNVNVVAHPGGVGIGGIAYVFGDIHQQTVDFTLRSSVLFSRNQSLEVYAQPFLTVGKYGRARELKRADSYEFIPYDGPSADGKITDFRDNDFTYSSVNLNLVYRWQYRPGSTFFLVYKQSRERRENRGMFSSSPGAFENGLGTRTLFRNEPENTLLAKVTYWLPI